MRNDIPEEDMPPWRRFVFTAPPPSLGNDTRTIARAVDRAEDVGYVRALQASEHRMMTSIDEVNLRVSYQAKFAVRGQKTAYETELHEVHQAYLSFEARNSALLARLETLETHVSRMEWQCQSDEDLAVTQMIRIHTLEARSLTDMVEDDDASQSSGGGLRRPVQPARVCSYTDFMKFQPLNFKGSEGIVGLSQWLEKMELVFHISGYAIDNQVKFATCTLLCATLTWWNGHEELMRWEEEMLVPPSLDTNVITGTFILNNRYAKILFDTGADRSFVSTTFSALIDITPNTLENHYDKELADGKIIGVNTIVHGFTLNFMNHPFNIDLMHVSLGSFDVIIGMDWLTKYHGVIICDEKIVRVPFGREMLNFQGSRDNQREESRLNIILCTKAQEYLSKGCDVFLEHVTMKEAKDKSEGKRLEEVPIVRDFPEVFLEGLLGIPPARQVEFQIDLVPGAALVARAPYRLAPSEMKELAKQLQELSNKGFIRPSFSP
nr:putative reverse transcriptase domain-containing protein [Tanacetum cinerariifolium]